MLLQICDWELEFSGHSNSHCFGTSHNGLDPNLDQQSSDLKESINFLKELLIEDS